MENFSTESNNEQITFNEEGRRTRRSAVPAHYFL